MAAEQRGCAAVGAMLRPRSPAEGQGGDEGGEEGWGWVSTERQRWLQSARAPRQTHRLAVAFLG